LRKPSSKTSLYSVVRRLAVIVALSSAVTADAFTSPGVQPSGVRPFQKVSNIGFAPILTNMLRPVNANRAKPNLATPQGGPSSSHKPLEFRRHVGFDTGVRSNSSLFSEEKESASSGNPDNDDLASLPFDEIAFEAKNIVRKRFSLKPLTPDEFMQIEAKVEEMASIQREKVSAAKAAAELAKPKKKSNPFGNLFGGILQDTCESNWDCQRPEICCDFVVKKACCNPGGQTVRSTGPEMMPIPVRMPPKDDGSQLPRGGPEGLPF